MTKSAYELVKQKLKSNLPSVHWIDEVVWPTDDVRPCLQMSTLTSSQNMISRDLMALKSTIQVVYYGAKSTASHDELVEVASQILGLFQNAFETSDDETRFETTQAECEIKEGLLYFKITLEGEKTKESEIYPLMDNLKFREV